MTFATFCESNLRRKYESHMTMADLMGGKTPVTGGNLRRKAITILRSLITEFDVKDDTFFEKITIPDVKLIRYSPDDEAYLLGRSRRGVWVVVDDCDIYVVARGKMFEEDARAVSYSICRAADEIFGSYSVCGCWAM